MTSRTQCLIFLSIWVLMIFFTAVAADLGGVNLQLDTILILAFVALLPAAIGHLLVRRVGSLIDDWRVGHGHDVYRERQYEDDAGFIHLNGVPPIEQQRDMGLTEIVADMEPLFEDNLKKDDSK